MVNSGTLECTLQKKWSLEMATPVKKVETARTEKKRLEFCERGIF